MTDTNPFAALLDGVPRYRRDMIGGMERDENGPYVFCDDVLATLAAVPADLAEAGKVAKRLVDWPTCEWNTVIQLRKDAHAQILALLARLAAQEAQIDEAKDYAETCNSLMRKAQRDHEAAETALAAERAKTAKLVEALNQYQLAAAGYVSVQSAKDKADSVLAAITEEGQ